VVDTEPEPEPVSRETDDSPSIIHPHPEHWARRPCGRR